ncbi:MAG: hybrid sensor histidine kinase/response regulator [Nitrospinota bacterium]|nr:hybrid sensor histidine kinase/response regulator [Nitrospinota bacterium]MDH5677146.1 hybrid sensor histidine kinase/response regulator [Nitrospinota bacterium]MDH5755982.1 hybrid sensor histidine kinase/response regulator [Nitrospinota bacterium]
MIQQQVQQTAEGMKNKATIQPSPAVSDQVAGQPAFDIFRYRERVYFWFCIVGVLTLFPVAISDYAQGRYIVGTAALVVFFIFALNVISMRSGGPPRINIQISGLIFVFMYPVVIHKVGIVGVLWSYTGIVFLALVLPARTGFAFNLGLLATVTPAVFFSLPFFEAIRSIITLAVVAGLARVFAGIIETEHEELRIAKEKAEEATKLKDKFVALVSHDLRSPIGGVINALELCNSPNYNLSPQHRVSMMNDSHKTLKGLLSLMEDLLTIGRLTTGSIRPTKKLVDVSLLAANVIESSAPHAREKGVVIENSLPESFTVLADRAMLTEILQNLLQNAIKFCNFGDTVTISRSPHESAGICVQDTGPGISEKLLPNLFLHEVKTTSLGTSGETGTGFGLPMCKELAIAQGGDIHVESNVGEGTLFTVSLPQPQALVLLVDDQEVQRRSIKAALDGDCPIEILEAENGKDALASMETVTPLLVIADLEMPVMDGFELITKIRENRRYDEIPIIVATSHHLDGGDPEKTSRLRQRVFDLGADDFITKPVAPEDLKPRVRRFLTTQRPR